MVLVAQEWMDQAVHSVPWEAKMGEAPRGLSAAEFWLRPSGSSLFHSLSRLLKLGSCFLAAFPAVRGARKSLKSNFLPKSG